MSNLGSYQKITTLCKQSGGVEKFISNIKINALQQGMKIGFQQGIKIGPMKLIPVVVVSIFVGIGVGIGIQKYYHNNNKNSMSA